MHRPISLTPPTERRIRVCGMDPSLRNWGLALGHYDLETKAISIEKLILVNPVLPSGKQVRQNSLDLVAAQQLAQQALVHTAGVRAVFAEVPVGSQNARAMASYGICVGVLGSLRATGVPFFELNPTEVKLAGFGKKTATKEQMIQWAMNAHPGANWPTYTRNGESRVSEAQAEHLADAVATIHAGIASSQFQQVLPLLAGV